MNAYNLAFACLLLTGAALGDRFGRRRMFIVGMAAFTVASAASALSPDMQALILARAMQGAAAAIVTPLTLTLICEAFPADKRAAIGMWGLSRASAKAAWTREAGLAHRTPHPRGAVSAAGPSTAAEHL